MSDAIRIRASSIASIMDCKLRGLSIMLGLVEQCVTTAPAIIGTAVHEGTAMFDREQLEGHKVEPDDMAGVVVDNIWHPDEEVNWGSITQKEAERRALGVYTRYCTDVAPRLQYEEVEMSLSPVILDVDGVELELTGKLDRVYSDCQGFDLSDNKEERGVLDLKTGLNACTAKPEKHIAQIATYELLYEHTTNKTVMLPGLIGALQTSREYQVDIKPVYNAKSVLLGDGDTKGLLEYVARDIKTGDWEGNTSSWLCSEKYCPLYDKCFFRGKTK